MKMRSPQASRSLDRLDVITNDDFMAPNAIDSSMISPTALRDLTLVMSLAKPSFGSSRTAGKLAIILIDLGEKWRPAAQPQQPSDSALIG